jgi:HAD superfamily hydrolase (TIGR01509 family)
MQAFDYAEQRSRATIEMASARLRDMLRRHVGWQSESLALDDPAIVGGIVERCAAEVEQATASNRRVLAALVDQGYRLGVVSNACGNAALLCEEYGYADMLKAIVDSNRFGASKPDLAIFRHALDLIGTPARRTAFVGDSLDQDIEPAKTLGLRTFWMADRGGSWPAAADIVLFSLDELPARLVELEARPV